MNWLDIIFIIALAVITLIALIGQIIAIKDEEYSFIGQIFIIWLMIFGLIFCIAFVKIDKRGGVSVGTITAVDKNFFGTTRMYFKTTENNEEEYCIEATKIADIAKENVGKKVRIFYGTRVGVYSTGRCDEAPIDHIDILNE